MPLFMFRGCCGLFVRRCQPGKSSLASGVSINKQLTHDNQRLHLAGRPLRDRQLGLHVEGGSAGDGGCYAQQDCVQR